jgi:hypothetical protein
MYSAGRNPDEFLNRYLTENMVACSRKPDKANLKVIWQPPISDPGADAERVIAWIEKRGSRTLCRAYRIRGGNLLGRRGLLD